MRDPETAYARTPLDTTTALATTDRRRIVLDGQGAVVTRDRETFESRNINPGIPLYPWLPRGEDPRQFYIQAGYNLNYVPRSEYRQLTPFALLRNLAASSDLVQIARQEVIDTILALEWDVVPEDPKEQKSKGLKSECDFAKDFLAYPDRIHSFEGWLHALLLDALDIDALCFYRRRTLGGDPHSLMVIDGATIKPILDWHGIPPEPPEVAYQQIIAGVPETEFSRPYLPVMEGEPEENPTELVYQPFSSRTYNGYGQSPLERILITVNLSLRRQLHHLAYFTDGNIPDAFWKCPDSWTAEQIFAFQEKIEKLLQGESAQRRKLRAMPGGEGTGLELPHGQEQEPNDLNEFLARVVCAAYHVSPQALVKMMNRATAEQADTSSSESGLHTWMHKVRKLVSRELKEFLGIDGVKFIYVEDKHRDEQAWTAKAIAFIGKGIYTRNHVLNEEGLDGIEGGDVVTVDTPTGPVPLAEFLAVGGAPGLPASGAAQAAQVLATVPPIPAAGAPAKPEAGTAAPPKVPPVGPEKGWKDDIRRWRKVALRAVAAEPDWKKRSPLVFAKALAFTSSVIPESVQRAIRMSLEDLCCSPGAAHRVEWTFGTLAKARRPLVAVRRRLEHEAAVRKVVADHFRKRTPAIVTLAVNAFRALQKSDDGLDGLDEALQINVLVEEVKVPLKATYLDGEILAADASGVEIAYGLTSEQATAYAEERAAELVGKRRLPDGTVVDSPNPRIAINDTLRNDLHDAITKALQEGQTEAQLKDLIEAETGWTYRADRIARTEVAFALNRGAADTYAGAGVNTVTIMDGPGCLEDGHDDNEEGVDGEVWSVAKFMAFPIGHPYCVRDARPNVGGEVPE